MSPARTAPGSYSNPDRTHYAGRLLSKVALRQRKPINCFYNRMLPFSLNADYRSIKILGNLTVEEHVACRGRPAITHLLDGRLWDMDRQLIDPVHKPAKVLAW
jgi:hypothetical protein